MSLRDKLQKSNKELFEIFESFISDIAPLLKSIEKQFPQFTRHDPSHNEKLESIAFEIVNPRTFGHLSEYDIFVLLCSLWIHDAAMGVNQSIENKYKDSRNFKEKLTRFQRLGMSEKDCWLDYLRENHHKLCREITQQYLGGRITHEYIHWISEIARSHGEKTLHDHTIWHKKVKVGDRQTIHPPVLGVTLRVADILHFAEDRAPEFMLQHLKISNTLSIQHWRAHQVATDYTLSDGICFFDGISSDDESYWFAQQFIQAMDDEVKYCIQYVLPYQDKKFNNLLAFSRVENRIRPQGFIADKNTLTLQIETSKFLEDLLNDSLYANKPTWFREILQNCFDACRDKVAYTNLSVPEVTINVNSEDETIIFSDSGIGMTKETVEKFLLVAGASYWTSDKYKESKDYEIGHVGKFGIGFMSVFGIANNVIVETRHVSTKESWKFKIRGPRQCVRIEKSNRAESGTTITVYTKRGILISNPPVELFERNCTFPEFPVKLIVDENVEVDIPKAKYPNTKESRFKLKPISQTKCEAKLSKFDLSALGIVGDFYLPKIKIKALDCFVPDYRNWLGGNGWNFNVESAVYFGGINYPRFHSVGGIYGFNNIPSLGSLRIAVSPNIFPLEMNLARENFIAGPACKHFFRELCRLLDEIICRDLRKELANKNDPSIRSAIASRYSISMLNAWVGQVPSPSLFLSNKIFQQEAVSDNPWPKLTQLMMDELRFIVSDKSGKTSLMNISSLVYSGSIVFASGNIQGKISPNLLDQIFAFDPSSKLIIGLPDVGFGIQELRLWANEEILLPVPQHCRTAFGLRFRGERPFSFYPRECDHLTIPSVSSVQQFAVVDYRDWMAESKGTPTGTDRIAGVLNRKHPKVSNLLEELLKYDIFSLKKIAYAELKRLKDALTFGSKNLYNQNCRAKLRDSLNEFITILRKNGAKNLNKFGVDDFPGYFDGGQVVPFGRFMISDVTVQTLQETSKFEGPFQLLS